MMKIVYDCYYDGGRCEIIPIVDNNGVIVEPKNNSPEVNYGKTCGENWEICNSCPRNCGYDSHGVLRIIYE